MHVLWSIISMNTFNGMCPDNNYIYSAKSFCMHYVISAMQAIQVRLFTIRFYNQLPARMWSRDQNQSKILVDKYRCI